MGFGPKYTKIETLWKRREGSGLVMPGEFSLPEFEFLASNPWNWTEKINGENLRLYWDGTEVTIGGRTDTALLPAALVSTLRPLTTDTERWKRMFPRGNVTVHGEAYGAGINGGGKYRQDLAMIVFDVRVHDEESGDWWLRRPHIENVASGLGLDVVPFIGTFSLWDAWGLVSGGELPSGVKPLVSAWDGVPIEGIVGKPEVELKTRKGERILTKIKLADYHRLKNEKIEARVALLGIRALGLRKGTAAGSSKNRRPGSL